MFTPSNGHCRKNNATCTFSKYFANYIYVPVNESTNQKKLSIEMVEILLYRYYSYQVNIKT